MNNKRRNVYILSLFVFSVVAVIFITNSYPASRILDIVILGIFAAVAESLSVSVGDRFLSVSSAITLCGLISYGPVGAIWPTIISLFFRIQKRQESNTLRHILNTPIHITALNFGLLSLSSACAAFLYVHLGGIPLYEKAAELNGNTRAIMILVSQQALYIIVAIFVEMLVNTLLCAGYEYTIGRGSLLQEWVHDFFWSFAGLLVVGLLGVLLTAFYLSYNWFIVLLFFAPLFLARYTFSLYSNLRVSYMDTVKSLADAIEAKDLYTRGHSQRVQEYSEMIAEELRFSPKQKEILKYAALLHDIGKIGVTETILNKPGRLDQNEFDTIKSHPELGARIIANIKYLKECVPIIKYHHKYFDGSGYPDVSPNEEVPFESYILGVADAFDAMTSKRQYREPFSHDRAIAEIRRCAGSQFEPKVADAFLKSIERQQGNENVHGSKTNNLLNDLLHTGQVPNVNTNNHIHELGSTKQ